MIEHENGDSFGAVEAAAEIEFLMALHLIFRVNE